MSIFSFISRGRQAAKDHKNAKAQQEKQEIVKKPYKHIPVHAATDAMSGAPAAFRSDDRQRILDAHKRRSAIYASSQVSLNIGVGASPLHTNNGMGMGSRVHSSLSNVSYPNSHANPVRVPRAYSYGSAPTGWHYNGGESSYSGMTPSIKGKEVDRRDIDSGIGSKVNSKDTSPVGSSAESTSSQDELEMKPKRMSMRARPASFMPTEKEQKQRHRLHPSQRTESHSKPPSAHRPNSETPASALRSSSRTSQRSSRHVDAITPGRPGSASGSASAGPSQSSYPSSYLPPMQFANSATPVARPTIEKAPKPYSPPPKASSRASINSHKKKESPPSSLSQIVSHGSDDSSGSGSERNARASYIAQAKAVPAPRPVYQNSRRASRASMRELETINSVEPHKLPSNEASRMPRSPSALPTDFDESKFVQPMRVYSVSSITPEPTPVEQPQETKKKGFFSSSKPSGGAKLAKKNRWSMRSSSQPVAAAF